MTHAKVNWIKILGLNTILFLSSLCGLARSSEVIQIKEFGLNPGKLKMYYYQPLTINVSKPLVVLLHGCGQSGIEVMENAGWDKLADSLGFSLLIPQTDYSNNVSKCFNWYKPEHNSNKAGESASIKNMIDFLIKQDQVDSAQIYIYGLSAGGAMAVAMLAQYPETFVAGAIFGGGPYGTANNLSEAKKALKGKAIRSPKEWGDLIRIQNPGYSGEYPRIVIFHGKKDKIVNPANSQFLVDQWKNLHGSELTEYKSSINGHSFIENTNWNNEQGKTVVQLYLMDNTGHTVPIKTGDDIKEGGKAVRNFKDLGYHSTWQCVLDFGLANE